MLMKLLTSVVLMFGFGYALVPLYRAICEVTGINVLAWGEVDRTLRGNVKNTQVDDSRTITVVFDTNARGPWAFKPEVRSMEVHPGQVNTIVYEFENVQRKPFQVTHPNRLQPISTSWSVFASPSTLWPLVKKRVGQWFSLLTPSCQRTSRPSRCLTLFLRWVQAWDKSRPLSLTPRERQDDPGNWHFVFSKHQSRGLVFFGHSQKQRVSKRH
jgi:hypothetical protein